MNAVAAYQTNGGNLGKFIVTAITGTSLTIQYTTYISVTPKITGVQNNYSLLVTGLPNYGIAPGSLFIIKGSSLASIPTSSVTLQRSERGGNPQDVEWREHFRDSQRHDGPAGDLLCGRDAGCGGASVEHAGWEQGPLP